MSQDTYPAALPRPAAGEPRPYNFPAFEQHRLSNQLRVTIASIPTLPVVTTLAVVDAGSTRDPDGYEGLATLTMHALEEGTESMDALALAERLELLGTTLNAGADWDSAVIHLTSLSSRVGDAFEVLADVLRRPAFPESELDRLRQERLADLAQLKAEPRGLADVYFSRVLYEPGSRFARLSGGDETSIMRLNRDMLVAHHGALFTPSNITLMIVGDITVADGLALAERCFGDWAEGDLHVNDPHARQRYAEPRVHLIDKADAPQSEIRAGHVSVPRLHEDYFPIVVMNAILGGLFSSRLNLNLREEHAFTYGAHSAFGWRRAPSPFEMSTAVETGVTADAVREIVKEFNRIRETEVSEAELSLAVSYLDGVFPIRFETTAAVAGGLANLEIFHLPSDYFDSYRENVRAVTAQDVLRVARAHLDPGRLQVVVVGDASAVRGPLEELGIGAVTVYDAASYDNSIA